MQRPTLVLGVAVVLSACGGASSSSTRGAQAAPPAAVARDAALGSINGKIIGLDDLEPDLRRRLDDLDNETQQRRLHLLWAGLEDRFGEQLLATEAKRRGVSVAELREKEVLAKVTQPTEEELEQFYDHNAERIGVDYKTAAPHIKTELVTERARAIERAFVEGLRDQAQIRYTLPLPALPRFPLDIGKGPSWGSRDAKVTIVEFSDFQCPYCARASVVLKRMKELYPTELRIEFRDFPLAQHNEARRASEAARCADEQGKFWEYHDVLFANPRALGEDDLKKTAAEVGLDLASFTGCLASDRPKEAVDKSVAIGQKAGVQGTPAIYINGIKLVGLLPLPLLQAFVDRELGR